MTADGAAGANGDGLLRMRELAAASGVPAPTIKHYLREGLLPEPVKTSRNMAYYPPEFVERIRLIKRLQEERFLPLKLIRGVLEQASAKEQGERPAPPAGGSSRPARRSRASARRAPRRRSCTACPRTCSPASRSSACCRATATATT